VIFVPAETRSVEVLVLALFMVPTLWRVLCCPTGFRRGEMDPDCELRLPLRREPRRRKS